MLGGEAGQGAFTTPLATLHKWNGWADRFLRTPENGLRDLSIGAGHSHGRMTYLLVYHRFEADSGGATYGQELDALFKWSSWWDQDFYFKAAAYDADEFAFDTMQFWLYTTYKFGSS